MDFMLTICQFAVGCGSVSCAMFVLFVVIYNWQLTIYYWIHIVNTS